MDRTDRTIGFQRVFDAHTRTRQAGLSFQGVRSQSVTTSAIQFQVFSMIHSYLGPLGIVRLRKAQQENDESCLESANGIGMRPWTKMLGGFCCLFSMLGIRVTKETYGYFSALIRPAVEALSKYETRLGEGQITTESPRPRPPARPYRKEPPRM